MPDLTLDWGAFGPYGTDFSGSETVDTGGVNVSVGFTAQDEDASATTFNAPGFVGEDESFDAQSFLKLIGQGGEGGVDDTSVTTIDFSSSNDLYANEVQNVEFRLNDIDGGGSDIDPGTPDHQDIVTIRAYDAEGNLLDVTITYQGASETGTAPAQDGEGSSSADSAGGSLLVEIAGPVSYIEIDYDQLGGSGQVLYVSDVHFTAVGRGDGDDTIDGGDGADMVLGGEGDDRITVDRGDTAEGGAGDDTFVLEDADDSRSGNAAISITGGEGDESEGDTLILTPDVSRDDITFTETDDDAGGLSGSFTTDDGTLVEFTEIENIICFTPGTMILTEMGERPVETLRPGDRVVTRDSGVQPIRWRGKRRVDGRGRFAPVRVAPTVAGEGRQALLVSPQHRLLYTGYQAQLLFGQEEVLVAAKHLIDGAGIRRCRMEEVTYIHLMFDHHEVIYAEGIATESFHAGDVGLSALCEAAREELFALFPELRSAPRHLGDTARQCLKQYEARLLVDTEQARGALVG